LTTSTSRSCFISLIMPIADTGLAGRKPMLRRFSGGDVFEHRMQLAERRRVASSTGCQTALAEQYVVAPLPGRVSFRAAPVRTRTPPATGREEAPSDPPLPA
jgi:hypothetical protein